jgi:hypothetical protein
MAMVLASAATPNAHPELTATLRGPQPYYPLHLFLQSVLPAAITATETGLNLKLKKAPY